MTEWLAKPRPRRRRGRGVGRKPFRENKPPALEGVPSSQRQFSSPLPPPRVMQGSTRRQGSKRRGARGFSSAPFVGHMGPQYPPPTWVWFVDMANKARDGMECGGRQRATIGGGGRVAEGRRCPRRGGGREATGPRGACLLKL